MPGPVAVDIGTPSPRSSFEEIHHPPYSTATSALNQDPASSWSSYPPVEELPMHYISDDKARRRIIRPLGGLGPGSSSPLTTSNEPIPIPHSFNDGLGNGMHSGNAEDDDGGREVYGKMRAAAALRQIPRPPPTTFQEDLLEHLPAAIYTLLSCWTRFYKIGASNHVVWDEAHFGKFGSYYLRVSPPVGSLSLVHMLNFI